jgi:glycosyltransferase involved in cell wall biosynthesis
LRIHFWSADNSGSAFYRAHLPALGLSWLGHQPSVGTRMPGKDDARGDWSELDVVVGSRVAKPGVLPAWQKLKDMGVRLILDLDDNYLVTDPTNQTAHRLWTDPVMRTGLLKAAALADTVTVCSAHLARVMGEHHGDVRLIPNGLPAQYLSWPRDYDPEELNVGWSGSGSTMHELPLAARHLSRISDYRSSISTILVGITQQDALKAGVKGARCHAIPFLRKQNDYLQAVHEFDVWVAPYRDIPFNRAKFATKALEAGFLGIPLIASAIEPYAQTVVHGETGFLVPVGQEHLFGRYLKQLVDDPALRQRMGLAGRAQASASILQALNKQWEKVLQG